jgi:energy-coupling factor transport system substrate-specific component
VLSGFLGFVAFLWPFVVAPGAFSSTETPPLMFGALLARVRGKAEIAMLAAYGALAGYFFGFMPKLSFWPFSLDPTSSIAYRPGLSFTAQWHRYPVFDATTSLGWDTGRAVTDVVLTLITGPAVLAVLRRAARKANFRPPVEFAPPPEQAGADPS